MNKILVVLALFLLLGAVMIKCSLDTDFSKADERRTFLGAFVDWIGQLFSNLKATVGYAVKDLDWFPDDQPDSSR